MNIKLKKADIFILIFFLSISSGIFALYSLNKEQGKTAVIKTPTGEYEYPLDKDRVLKFKGRISQVIIEIKNGRVGFTHSDCPKKICIDMGFINMQNSMAACVPNRISVSIKSSNTEKEVDVICR